MSSEPPLFSLGQASTSSRLGKLPTKKKRPQSPVSLYCYAPDIYHAFVRIVDCKKINGVMYFELEWPMTFIPLMYLGKSALPRARELMLEKFSPQTWDRALCSWNNCEPDRRDGKMQGISAIHQAVKREESMEFVISWPNHHNRIEELSEACLPQARDQVLSKFGIEEWDACLIIRRKSTGK